MGILTQEDEKNVLMITIKMLFILIIIREHELCPISRLVSKMVVTGVLPFLPIKNDHQN